MDLLVSLYGLSLGPTMLQCHGGMGGRIALPSDEDEAGRRHSKTVLTCPASAIA